MHYFDIIDLLAIAGGILVIGAAAAVYILHATGRLAITKTYSLSLNL